MARCDEPSHAKWVYKYPLETVQIFAISSMSSAFLKLMYPAFLTMNI